MDDNLESGPAAAGPGSGAVVGANRLGMGASIRLMLVVAGALLALFGGFEVVERVWLTEADPGVLQTLHLARGIGAAALTAVLVLSSLPRWSPDFTDRPDAAGDFQAWSNLADKEQARIEFCSRWFVQMRWVAILVSGVVILLTVAVGNVLPHSVLVPLFLTIAALAVFNTGMWILVRKGRITRLLLEVQVYVDLTALTLMLHFSGGIENPLYILALFHVIIAGIILTKAQCFSVAATASLLVALMAFGEWSHVLDHYTLQVVPHGLDGDSHASHNATYVGCVVAIFSGTLFLTAHFVTRLSTQLRNEELRLTEWATRASIERKLLEQALATTSTAVRVRNEKLEPRWISPKWHEWFDAQEQGNGQGQSVLNPAMDGLTSEEVRSAELALWDPVSQEDRFFRVVTAPIFHRDGTIRQIVDLAQEITREKKAQERLMRASQLAVVGELASRVAHEVNNPIAIMSAKSRLLLSKFHDEIPQRVSDDLRKIVDLSDRVARIAQGLLGYSRPSTGSRVPVDVRDSITRALDLVRERAAKQNVDIETDLATAMPAVRANSQELEQVFLNLYMNAIHAMPDGGRLRIQASPAPGGDTARIPGVKVVVQDTGVGIPSAIRGRLFEPFFTTKEAAQGTGLGLSICYGLVDGLGGDIDVISESGDGASFIVWLPTTDPVEGQE